MGCFHTREVIRRGTGHVADFSRASTVLSLLTREQFLFFLLKLNYKNTACYFASRCTHPLLSCPAATPIVRAFMVIVANVTLGVQEQGSAA